MIRNRAEAGRLLASRLEQYSGKPDCMVVALPRGGVVTGYEIAAKLHLPLDVLIVRKLGVPGQPELAMGAIASGGVKILNQDIVESLRITGEEIEAVAREEQRELERRERVYRGGREASTFAGRTVILADDGIATGATMSAAIAALRQLNVGRIVVAVGVAPRDTVRRLQGEADEVVCVETPYPFQAISLWYDTFPQTTDAEVRALLNI